MKEAHLSDELLAQIVKADPDDVVTADHIETHVAECKSCQDRIVELAADSDWRQQFSASLNDMPSLKEIAQTDTSSFELNVTPAFDAGDRYEMQAVDRMLQEILSPPTHPEMLGRLDRYDVECVIGCGGMGVVLRGFDRDLHRPVAIKTVLPRLVNNGIAKKRFMLEARAAAAVLHPNVIAIHGINETHGIPWFVMPLVVGPSLKTLVQQNGPLPEREIVRIGMQIAAGLAAAHSKGLVHRDIKPENILVDNQINRVVITDFGLARRDTDEAMTRTGWLMGTLNYMSPEQSRGEDIDGRSDLFSLGGLLFFLATGKLPFTASTPMGVLHKIGNEPPKSIRELNNEVSETLERVTARLLDKDPQKRFGSAAELESFLENYIAHLQQPTKQPAPALPAARSQFNWKMPFAIGASVLLATVLGTLAISNWSWSNDGSGGRNGGQLGAATLDDAQPSNSTAPKPTAPSVVPRMTWAEVSKRHGLEDIAEFERQLNQLEQGFIQLDQAFETPPMTIESQQLLNDFRHLESTIETFNPEVPLQNAPQPYYSPPDEIRTKPIR